MSESSEGGSQTSHSRGAGAPRDGVWAHYTLSNYNATTYRYTARCNFCSQTFASARLESVKKHLLTQCKKVTPELKDSISAEIAKKAVAAESLGVSLGKKSLKRGATQSPLSASFDTKKITPQVQKELDTKLLRTLIMDGLPFALADSPWFLDFVRALRPNYVPSGSSAVARSLLLSEYARAKKALQEKLNSAENVTVSVDGWTSMGNQSVYACNVTFPDGSTALLDAKDLSDEMHTGLHIAGHIRDWIKQIGRERVGALCTDNAANMRVARAAVVSDAQLVHIVDYRCMMHAFSLLIGSILGHSWSLGVVSKAQRVVSYFRASHRPLALLLKEASHLNINATPVTSNTTRFTSVHLCLDSVRKLEAAFNAVLEKERAAIANSEVVAILGDRQFWISVINLCKMLEPFSQAVMAIQSDKSSMADVSRYWIYLARVFRTDFLAWYLPEDFKSHCFEAYNRRCSEMDNELCRLALFLDPRYKAGAASLGSISPIIVKAVSISNKRGFGPTELGRLANHMQAYNAGDPPFDLPYASENFSVKAWWRSVGNAAHELVSLAVFLYDIVPHAGSTERVFSIMGWFNSPRRNRLQVASLAMMTSIRSDLQAQVPRKLKAPKTTDLDVMDISDVDLLEAPTLDSFTQEPVPEPEEIVEKLSNFYLKDITDSAGQPPQSFTDLLLSDKDFVLHPQFDPTYVPAYQPAAQQSTVGNLSGSVEQVNAGDFVKSLFANMGKIE